MTNSEEIEAFIEIPAGSIYKYEFDKDQEILKLDRVLNQAIPVNYGFIPHTIAEDSDPLDIFVYTNKPLTPATLVTIDVCNIIHCIDNGFPDHKIIAVLSGELPVVPDVIEKILMYLKTYKTGFEVLSVGGKTQAAQEILECRLK